MGTRTTGQTIGGIGYELIDFRAPWEPRDERLPIVLQHGIGLDRHAWDPWVRRLVREWPVIAIDLRGHGRSAGAWDVPTYPVERFADDILDVLQACEVPRAHLVGESFGGTVCAALACAAGEQRVASLTTCSTAFRGAWVNGTDHWPATLAADGGVARWSRDLTEARFDVGRVPQPLVDWVVETQSHTPAQVVVGVRDSLLEVDLEPVLDRLTMPVLNVIGDSPFVDPRNAQRLSLGVPHVQNVFIPESRHGIALSHAAECCAATIEFLRRTERGRAETPAPE